MMLAAVVLLAVTAHAEQPAARCLTTAPTDVVRSARQICSGAPVAKSLRSVGLVDQPESDGAATNLRLLLETHGLRTALDLRLLDPEGQESAELMAQLRLGGVSIGDRSKLRLLLGEFADDSEYSNPPAGPGYSIRRSRQLQATSTSSDGGGGDVSADTIAIVLSVLVGGAGYLVQAYTAGRAQRSLAEQAQELHTRELARQREHEQMVAQIARTDRAVDDCCRPIQAVLDGVLVSRIFLVAGTVLELEKSAPEVVAQMLQQLSVALVNGDGSAVSTHSGRVVWDPARRSRGITQVHPNHFYAAHSAAAFAVSAQDVFTWKSQPFSEELPTTILEFLAANTTEPLARRFRLYVRHSLLPSMRRAVALFDAHGAVMQAPPVSWMKAKFPDGTWHLESTRFYRDCWCARTQAWMALVGEWDTGDVETVLPANAFLPLAGLHAVNDWAIAYGEERQQELIGCERWALVFNFVLLAIHWRLKPFLAHAKKSCVAVLPSG